MRKRHASIVFGLIALCALLVWVAVHTDESAWAIPIAPLIFAFGVWERSLRCPVCKTSLIEDSTLAGLFQLPRPLPSHCRRCGHPLDQH
jgi:hypothetical protein